MGLPRRVRVSEWRTRVLIFFVLFRRRFDLAPSSSSSRMELESIGGGRREGEQTSEHNPEIWISVRVVLARIDTWEMEGCNEIIACLRSLVLGIRWMGSAHWMRYFRLGIRATIGERLDGKQPVIDPSGGVIRIS